MVDGLMQDQAQLCETMAQRVLGNERFVETVTCRAVPTQALSARPRRVTFGPLMQAVAIVHRMTSCAVHAPGL